VHVAVVRADLDKVEVGSAFGVLGEQALEMQGGLIPSLAVPAFLPAGNGLFSAHQKSPKKSVARDALAKPLLHAADL
ncbi:MAG: hypothetical protein CFE26_22750, partial [Verrucomicrobiales bacterium VVV1]